MHKRKSSEPEREIRGVIAQWPDIEEFTPGGCGIKGHGIEIAIDMSRLVERIHLAPRTPGWFSSAVEAVTRRFGYGFPIERNWIVGRIAHETEALERSRLAGLSPTLVPNEEREALLVRYASALLTLDECDEFLAGVAR